MSYDGGTRVQGCYLLYLTNNMVKYHVVQQGSSATPLLHALVRRVKLLMTQLEIMLEVVHIPGDLAIQLVQMG
eukprot:12710504-Ditylum_brightwellii.AAC.1